MPHRLRIASSALGPGVTAAVLDGGPIAPIPTRADGDSIIYQSARTFSAALERHLTFVIGWNNRLVARGPQSGHWVAGGLLPSHDEDAALSIIPIVQRELVAATRKSHWYWG